MRTSTAERIVRSYLYRLLKSEVAQPKHLKRALTNLHEKYSKHESEACNRLSIEYEPDIRTGYETYGYESPQSIHHNVMYISDRFRCAFRIKWILDGVTDGHFNIPYVRED